MAWNKGNMAGKSFLIAVTADFARRIDGLNMVCKHPLGFIGQDALGTLHRQLEKGYSSLANGQ